LKTYHIPNTELDVSRLAYGTWHLGGEWNNTPPTDEIKALAVRMINAAVDSGITHIDLADIYTKGKSDSVVGHALAQSPGLRDKLVLQAKAGIVLGDDPNPGDPGRYDFSYEHLVGAVEGTLQRLGTDRVDLLALHRPDALMEPEEVARAFDHLHSSGKVRYFGLSNHNVGQMVLLKKYVDQPLVLNQLELNLLHHYLISDGLVANTTDAPYTGSVETLDYCRMHDMMVQAWSPVAGGAIFNPPADAADNVKAVAGEITTIAQSHSTTPEAIAVAWLLRHPAGIQPIIGTQSDKRLAQTVPADDVELSRVEWYRLLAAARGAGVP